MRTIRTFSPVILAGLIVAITIFSVGSVGQTQTESSIALEKTVSEQQVYAGSEVTYTYEVTNTGDTDLEEVVIDDDTLGLVSGPEDLGPGESSTYELTETITEVTTNNAIATASDPQGNQVSDEASVTVTIIIPEVYVDVKPTSCPNPLNTKKQGVVSVAILGSEHLDVQELIDASSVTMAGVGPIRHSYEDVASWYQSTSCGDCSTSGPDGYEDLVFKFEAQQLIEALGPDRLSDGQCAELSVTGSFKGLYEGETFSSSDFVKILKKGNNGRGFMANKAIEN